MLCYVMLRYVFTCVYLSVNRITEKKTSDQIFIKFYGLIWHNPGTDRLDFE